MRLVTAALLLLVAAPIAYSGDPSPAAAPPAAMTEDQKVVYALGLALGQRLGDFALTQEELALVEKGLADSVFGRPPAIDLQVYGPKIMELAQSRQKIVAERARKEGAAYLETAAKQPRAKKAESGLVYIEERAGTGPSPTAADKIKIHYHGTLIDGTVFDSSVERGAPVEFELGSLVKCWVEGIPMMKVGGKAKLICPSDLAYGERGAPPLIKPGATLVFDVELLEILKPEAAAPPAAPSGTP